MTDHNEMPPLINPYDAPKPENAAEQRAGLQVNAPATSHRKPGRAPASQAPSNPDDLLTLPRGALVALRKSGGLVFSMREVVVFRNGRVMRRSEGAGQALHEDRSLQLPDEQLAELEQHLSQASFPRFAGTRHSPDSFVYQIAARVGRQLKTAEASRSSLPASLAPLVSWLERLLPHGR